MMVESALDAPQDYGAASPAAAVVAGLPQWKRELLQRRAARSSLPPAPRAPPPAPPPPPPPPPLPPDDDEELRYGPGIVKRLKSRYLSLALRDAPRRRPSVLRRAASLEHLLEHPPPPPSPASPAPPAPAPRHPPPARAHLLSRPAVAARRESIKRARSVDALSRLERLDSREEEPRPAPRAPRPPRRPAPLLSDAERPPPDVVRSTLRKFECAPSRRAAPAARVSGVLRGLARTPPRSTAAATQTTPSLRARPPPPPRVTSPRCSTPEPRTRTPSPAAADLSAIRAPPRDELDEASPTKVVSRAALEGIARAGASVRYSFECAAAADAGSHLPALAAANPVVLGRVRLSPSPRQVGVIRPMPAPARSPEPPLSPLAPLDLVKPILLDDRLTSDDLLAIAPPASPARLELSEDIRVGSPPPSKLTNGVDAVRAASEESEPDLVRECSSAARAPPSPPPPPPHSPPPPPPPAPSVNGEAERVRRALRPEEGRGGVTLRKAAPRPAASAATTVVFNFSNRKEVPDYIENDGLILRAARKDRLKAGDAGVVRLRAEGGAGGGGSDSDSEPEWAEVLRGGGGGAASPPCDVRFYNDNVLINGRSNLAQNNRDRIAKLKLQFDDSLTRTFEYPSESSLCDEASPAAPPAAPLAANTHLAGGPLASYRPSKILLAPAAFQLGVTRAASPPPPPPPLHPPGGEAASAAGEEYLKPCAEAEGRAWSDTRHTDLLF